MKKVGSVTRKTALPARRPLAVLTFIATKGTWNNYEPDTCSLIPREHFLCPVFPLKNFQLYMKVDMKV